MPNGIIILVCMRLMWLKKFKIVKYEYSQKSSLSFIIWERSRIKEEEIIGKLKNEFQILDMYEIKWSKGSFENNIRRFYGSKLQDVKMKIKDCGDGPFLLVILRDNNCKFDYKRTAFGIEKVNQNVYDKKHELRRMTNTGFAIHSSLNQKETNEDITLLMGKNLDDYIKEINGNWDGIVEKLKQILLENMVGKMLKNFYML